MFFDGGLKIIHYALKFVLLLLSAGLGRDRLIAKSSMWVDPIRACNKLGIFFIFRAFFNFDLKVINFDLKGINF